MSELPKPLKDRILVEKLPNEAKTPSGIILPVNVHKNNRAKVVSVGPDVKDIKVGDVVRYYQGNGVPYTEGAKSYLFLRTSVDYTDVEFVI